MATHNQVRVIGYLLKDPKIINEGVEGMEKILFQMRTTRRDIEGYNEDKFADLIVFYDGTELMNKMKNFKKFDIVDIKGVFNILPVNKKSVCTVCGSENIKYNGSSTFVYPIYVTRHGSYIDYFNEKGESPDALLEKNYKEVSNQCLIIGTVVTEPELMTYKKKSCCRYGLGVDRKYYIGTQDDITADYPWVYSYGAQAELDHEKLVKEKSLILVDGFIHNKQIKVKCTCENCGSNYTHNDVGTQFTPYSVEYLSDYITDEELAMAEEDAKRRKIHEDLS